MIPDITDREFDRVVERATTPVLVEFWQPGCGGCQVLMKELEKIREEVGSRLLILKMNVQDNYQIPAELEISSLPALALYRNGRFERFIGGMARKTDILKQLDVPPDT
ncbi:MAG TPA: thioredoxin domain-containing protein [Nitrospiraceae bacterium]|nr:thioredoxin domain-containing protein [Nitrospiraceae bacterium]